MVELKHYHCIDYALYFKCDPAMTLSEESREHCRWLLKEILEDTSDNNVVVVSQDGDGISINRLVLASVSPVLKELLLDEGDCIILPDVKIDLLRKLQTVLLGADVQSQDIHNVLPLLEYLEVNFKLDQSQPRREEKCTFCGEIFVSFKQLESHIEKCQKLTAEFSCDDCNQIFYTFEELRSHCQEYHGNLDCETPQAGEIEFLIDGESEACLLRVEDKKLERKFDCEHPGCLKSFTTKLQLKHHTNIHLGLKPYNCQICSKSFTQPTHLKIHQRVHDGSRPYMCSVCGKTFAIGSNMRKHLAIHDREASEVMTPASPEDTAVSKTEAEPEQEFVPAVSAYPCSHCEAVLSTKRDLAAHSAAHEEINPHFCPAPGCGLRFHTEKKLSGHERKIHGKQHRCSFCEKVCISASQLSKHILSHTGEKPFKCQVCNKAFSQKSHATFHVKTVHSAGQTEKYSCPECGKYFSSAGVLKKHKMWHSGQRPFQCEVCSKSFVQKSHLKVHYAKHTGERPFLCLECGKNFSTKQHLKEHSKLHAGTKPWYECTKCEARYRGQTDLAVHMRRHTGEAPYQCRETGCNKCFRSLRSLENHSRIHSGTKPFLCENCKKSFTTASGLRQHFKHNLRCQAQAKPGTFSFKISRVGEQDLGNISIDIKQVVDVENTNQKQS